MTFCNYHTLYFCILKNLPALMDTGHCTEVPEPSSVLNQGQFYSETGIWTLDMDRSARSYFRWTTVSVLLRTTRATAYCSFSCCPGNFSAQTVTQGDPFPAVPVPSP